MDLSRTHARQKRVLGVVLGINVVTFVVVVAGAYLSKSASLLSGGLDNFGDALTYTLSLLVVGASVAAQSRVALVKGFLILAAALAVAGQIAYRLLNPTVPIFETMGIIGFVNLGANAACLWLLTPYRHGDVNMASAWECSRNDIYEGTAVLAAAGLIFVFDAGWPDLVAAIGLLVLFAQSSIRVLREAFRGLRATDPHAPRPAIVQDVVCKCNVNSKTTAFRSELEGRQYHFCALHCKAAFDADPHAFLAQSGKRTS